MDPGGCHQRASSGYCNFTEACRLETEFQRSVARTRHRDFLDPYADAQTDRR